MPETRGPAARTRPSSSTRTRANARGAVGDATPLDRPPEDAAEPGRQLNRLNDVRRSARRSSTSCGCSRLPQLPLYVVTGDELVPWLARRLDPHSEESVVALTADRRGITGAATASGESICWRTPSTASMRSRSRARTTWTSRSSPSRSTTAPRHRRRGHLQARVDQFDEDDVQLLEVLVGHASVAHRERSLTRPSGSRRSAPRPRSRSPMRARLQPALASQSRSTRVSSAPSTGRAALEKPRSSVWLQERDGRTTLVARAFFGYDRGEPTSWGIAFRTRGARQDPRPRRAFPARGRQVPIGGSMEPVRGRLPVAPLRLDGDGSAASSFARSRREARSATAACVCSPASPPGQARGHDASSFESLERTFLSTVEALSERLEANDEYTSSHARWITEVALRVGRELGLDAKALKHLESAPLKRHRQDRRPRGDPLQAGRFRRGMEGFVASTRAGAGSSRDRAFSSRSRDRPALPRALGRPGGFRNGLAGEAIRSSHAASSSVTPTTR